MQVNDVERLSEIYAVSNTPEYLVRHFSKNGSVQNLSAVHSAIELVGEIRRVLSIESPSLEDRTKALAATVALRLLSADVVEVALSTLDERLPNWIQSVLDVVQSNLVAGMILNVRFPSLSPRVETVVVPSKIILLGE